MFSNNTLGQPMAGWDVIGLRPSRLELSVERLVTEAWERFVTGLPLEETSISKLVLSSWERSRRGGVAPGARLAPMSVNGDALEQLRRKNHDFLWAAQGLVLATSHLMERSGSMLLLTDPNGVILQVAGDRATIEAGKDIHLVEGGNWNEGVVGTNGIGTTLAMRLPAQVHGAEHFCEGIKRWTCAAAPVFFPGTDQILGVVDISGPPATYQANSLVLAVAAARQIEAMLAERISREHSQLLDACLKMGNGGDYLAMIVLDARAQLIHITGSLPGSTVRFGGHLPGLEPGRPVEDWARRLPDGLRPEWLHPVRVNGRAIGALLLVPKHSNCAGTERNSDGVPAPNAAGLIAAAGRQAAVAGFASLVGESPVLQSAIARARQLSGRRVAVLIQGETGVGKELFAREIHGEESCNGPFVSFNCGATTKELIASELFGHVRGAFTGATNEGRAGRFELAHGGTLCLDEIGELPLELQPVLLRALEEGVVYRLGEAKPRRVDVRLLAMTNRNLMEEVDAGRFRRDLYHRVCVTRIIVPPLRARGHDIEQLIEHFNRSLAERHHTTTRSFGPKVMAILRAYAWPGNVRELRNVVEGLLLTSNDDQVDAGELPEEMHWSVGGDATGEVATAPVTSLEDTERQAVVCALASVHGNLTQAARVLGVSRSTLYRKVEHYKLAFQTPG